MISDIFSKKNMIICLVVIAFCIGLYFLLRENNDLSVSIKQPNPIAKAIEISRLPTDTSNLSVADKKAYDELSVWVSVPVTNQPTISKDPQSIILPNGWTAREDYLTAVVPPSLSAKIKSYRSVIMHPPRFKTMSRDDAIYNVPDASNAYFKDHCHISGEVITCYGGKNPDTKHIFDLMFYFSK